MFARFRSLFSKNKTESEIETKTSFGNLNNDAETSGNVKASCNESPKLEGLNFLKSIVANEQKSQMKAESVRHENHKSETFDNKAFENAASIEPSHESVGNSEIEKQNLVQASHNMLLSQNIPSNIVDFSNVNANINLSPENSAQLSESSEPLSQSSIKESRAYSTTQSSLEDLELNTCYNSSIVVEDLPSEITTPSPTAESTKSGSSSNTSALVSSSISENLDATKIVVSPINNNSLACIAITNKLSDIAEVAESLDAIIREVQENVRTAETDDSNSSPIHKKLDTMRSASSEDWYSRSTEDDSFVTASEGNFTPSSSSFQTASGRTSSHISGDKNSFDANEADDSTYAYEMPELTSPLNMSFEGSEQSYLSAQPLNCEIKSQDKEEVSEKYSKPPNPLEEDQCSTADIEERHSASVTPIPEKKYDSHHIESNPIESETELDVADIANAPSMEILTEHTTTSMSRTPEVSPTTSNDYSNQNPITTHMIVNMDRDPNDHQELQNPANGSNNKPNAAWRRSKYYENLTKQTIKGFL